MACFDSAPELHGVRFLSNGGTALGGGLFAENFDVQMTDVIFTNNSVWNFFEPSGSTRGGALTCLDSNLELSHAVFEDNWADGPDDGGGAVAIRNGTSVMADLVMRRNSNDRREGGAFYISGGSHSLSSALLAENGIKGHVDTRYGGAIYVRDAALQLTEVTIVDSASELDGSGIYRENSTLTLDRVIVANGVGGQGLFVADDTSLVELQCCDLFGNEGGDYGGFISDQTGLDGNMSLDPQFCGIPGSGNYLLQSDSPCSPTSSPCGLLIGSEPVGCGTTAIARSTWSGLKSLY